MNKMDLQHRVALVMPVAVIIPMLFPQILFGLIAPASDAPGIRIQS